MRRYEAKAEITGSVWKILKTVGDTVGEGDTLMIFESMKMEIPLISEGSGIVTDVCVTEGMTVVEGSVMMIIQG